MPRARQIRRAGALAALCGILAVLVPALPAGAQDGTDEGDPGTSTTVPLISPAGGEADEPSRSDQASQRIDMVVVALVVLALAVAVATVVFFRRTKPERVTAAEAAVVGGRLREIPRFEPEEPTATREGAAPSGFGQPTGELSSSDPHGSR